MKFSSLLLSALTLSTLSAHAFTCTERDAKTEDRIEVSVEQLADITKQVSWAEAFDKVAVVEVSVTQLVNGRRTPVTSFQSYAKYVDVMFNISAQKKHGFRMWRYFDEENEDGMQLTTLRGGKTMNLGCTYDQ